jgi:hypothetical protein
MREKLKVAFFAAYFLLAPLAGYYWNNHVWDARLNTGMYASYISGIERGKWVYVIDVHQPKVWADGEHDDSVALQKIIERSAGLNPTGVRPSITWFSEQRTHLLNSGLTLQAPSTIMGANISTHGEGTAITVKGN